MLVPGLTKSSLRIEQILFINLIAEQNTISLSRNIWVRSISISIEELVAMEYIKWEKNATFCNVNNTRWRSSTWGRLRLHVRMSSYNISAAPASANLKQHFSDNLVEISRTWTALIISASLVLVSNVSRATPVRLESFMWGCSDALAFASSTLFAAILTFLLLFERTALPLCWLCSFKMASFKFLSFLFRINTRAKFCNILIFSSMITVCQDEVSTLAETM